MLNGNNKLPCDGPGYCRLIYIKECTEPLLMYVYQQQLNVSTVLEYTSYSGYSYFVNLDLYNDY